MLVTSSRAIAEFAAVKSRNRNFVHITKLMHDTKTYILVLKCTGNYGTGNMLICYYVITYLGNQMASDFDHRNKIGYLLNN